jgi:protein-S-isoprenylcysteine O-methyltransferase Ste14
MWFRYRLAVMAAVFAVAIAIAILLARLVPSSGWLQTTGAMWGVGPVFLVSGVVCIGAFALRTWGEALLGNIVYGQGTGTGIVVAGPFRWSRNPLYVGTWLFFIAAVGPYLPVVVLVVLGSLFGFALRQIVADEEASLAERFGEAWHRYATAVPRFVGIAKPTTTTPVTPTLTDWAWGAVCNVFLATLGLYRISWFILEAPSRVLGIINIAACVIWLAVVIVRRLRH